MPESLLVRMSQVKVFREYLGGPLLQVSERIWSWIPASATTAWPFRPFGDLLHSLVKLRSFRTQYHGTFFLRNRAELELIRTFSRQKPQGSALNIAVMGCSNGAEVYSIVWAIRTVRPDLRLNLQASDISSEIVEIARNGLYSLQGHQLVNSQIFERLSEDEMNTLFDRVDNDQVRVKAWIAEGITWSVGNAADPELPLHLGQQDMVVANNFLCHMHPPDAERCLRNIARLVKPGGYLFVSGVDLEIRTKVAIDLAWKPVTELLEEIHDGDPSVRRDWPWKWWALEPIDHNKRDWNIRYASVFQLGLPL
jgi:chemotaxis methyl-accepting protein methylase